MARRWYGTENTTAVYEQQSALELVSTALAASVAAAAAAAVAAAAVANKKTTSTRYIYISSKFLLL